MSEKNKREKIEINIKKEKMKKWKNETKKEWKNW